MESHSSMASSLFKDALIPHSIVVHRRAMSVLIINLMFLQEIGLALMENDISLFKKSLEILQSLNEKNKLYTKVCPY